MPFASHPIAQTERLLLRPFLSEDAEAMQAIFCDAEVMRFSSGIKTPEWIRDWIVRCHEKYAAQGYGLWAVVERSSQCVIGYCGLTLFPDIDGDAEIEVGYRLARSVWRQGYATEAALEVRDHAFTALGIRRLIAIVDPENIASIRVAEKIGLHYEKDVMLAGYSHPDRIYASDLPRSSVV